MKKITKNEEEEEVVVHWNHNEPIEENKIKMKRTEMCEA